MYMYDPHISTPVPICKRKALPEPSTAAFDFFWVARAATFCKAPRVSLASQVTRDLTARFLHKETSV